MKTLTPHGWLGLMVIILAMALSALGLEFVRRWFYALAWWGYIFLLDGFIAKRRGASLILDRAPVFLLMAFLSTTFWFFFELMNLRLGNWHYVLAEPRLWLRWAFAWIAFATVLPGVLLTASALDCLGLKWPRMKPRRLPGWIAPLYLAGGSLMLALCLAWPRIFFPLVWLGVFFICDGLSHALGGQSLLGDWQKGELGRTLRLLLAGLITGLLWESWNMFSLARWVYTLPYLQQPRLFAMPAAGFSGFLPFALECFAFMALAARVVGLQGWQPGNWGALPNPVLPRWGLILLGLGLVGFNLAMCRLMDLYLVKSWAL